MNEIKHVKRVEAIPVPKTIRDAFMMISDDIVFTEHQIYGLSAPKKQKNTHAGNEQESVVLPNLADSQAAFFMGKYIPPTFKERVANLMDWPQNQRSTNTGSVVESENKSPTERIYTADFIKACLHTMFKHKRPGEKARFFIAPLLSEIANGSRDVEHALSAEKHKQLIEKIARIEFGKTEQDLVVINLDQDPNHLRLFDAIKESKNEDGSYDLDSVLLNDPDQQHYLDPKQVDSLELARYLYTATQKSQAIKHIMRSPIPEKLAKKADEEAMESMQNYTIIELAVQLAEIYRGRYIHGGADRQYKYDLIIGKILQGKKGKYAKFAELDDLLTIFEGKRYESVNIDTKNNPYALKTIRSRARARIAMVLTGMGLLVGSGYYGNKHYEERERQQEQAELTKTMNQAIQQEVKDLTFKWDYKWPRPKESNYKTFNSMKEFMLEQIKLRYGFSDELIEDLGPLLAEYMILHKQTLTIINESKGSQIEMADDFIREKALYFKSRGMELQMPYKHFEKYYPLFDQVFAEDYKVANRTFISEAPVYGETRANPHLNNIGSYIAGRGYNVTITYELAVFTDAEETKHLVAYEYPSWKIDPGEFEYTSHDARKFVCIFSGEMAAYQASELDPFEKYLTWYAGGRLVKHDFEKERKDLVQPFITYTSQEGITYEVASANYPFEGSIFLEPVAIARKEGEEKFSTNTARELADYYYSRKKGVYHLMDECKEKNEDPH